MPEFDGPAFGMPPVMGGDNGPGGLYDQGINFMPSAGMEKNADKQDEKVKVNDIYKIPKYRVIKRFKALKTYVTYKRGYNVYKRRMLWNIEKLNRINEKLEAYSHYPDDSVNRDKLVSKQKNLEYELRRDQSDMSGIIKDKMDIYGKALGFRTYEDDKFEIYGNNGTNKKQQEKTIEQEEDYGNNYSASFDEEKIEQFSNEKETENSYNKTNNLNDDGTYRLTRDQITNNKYYIDDNKKAQLDSKIKEASVKQDDIANKIVEEFANLYISLSEKYGEDIVKKYWNGMFNSNNAPIKKSEADLDIMLENINNSNTTNSIKK